MRIIFYLIIFAFINIDSAGASEIFGRISTNPKELLVFPKPEAGNQNIASQTPAVQGVFAPPVSGAAPASVFLPRKSQPGLKNEDNEIKVLGAKYYPDYSLLRKSDKKIFIIEGRFKKRILNLQELKKYRSQVILDVSIQDFSQYQECPYLSGELVRVKGQTRIYYLEKEGRRAIRGLSELRSGFAGKAIRSISKEELKVYPEVGG